jgi:hypothetical protein
MAKKLMTAKTTEEVMWASKTTTDDDSPVGRDESPQREILPNLGFDGSADEDRRARLSTAAAKRTGGMLA